MDTKTRMAEEAPLTMNKYFFDFEAIEEEKEMIQYGEVFPCENNMLIDFGAKRLLLCDMYCLNPVCNCPWGKPLPGFANSFSGQLDPLANPVGIVFNAFNIFQVEPTFSMLQQPSSNLSHQSYSFNIFHANPP